MSVTHSLSVVAALVLLPAVLAAGQAGAATRCKDNGGAALYLQQPVQGITPVAIADNFVAEVALPYVGEHAQAFWKEFGTREGEVEALVAEWNAGDDVKQAVIEDAKLLRQLRKTIVAFEEARVSPENAAEILAGEWNDWRASHMSRDEFIRLFLSEVASRRDGQGVPVYGAILQGAQATRNRLDDLNGAAGMRDPPDDPLQMWLWDSYIRGKAAAAEVGNLRALRDGEGYWNDFLMGRHNAIRCVAAKRE